MNGINNPPRHGLIHRPDSPTKSALVKSEAAVPPGQKSRRRHGAITDNLSKLHSYKAWAANVRDHWEDGK